MLAVCNAYSQLFRVPQGTSNQPDDPVIDRLGQLEVTISSSRPCRDRPPGDKPAFTAPR